jgi:HAD superfamily hydrolase (TIGR01549 family)
MTSKPSVIVFDCFGVLFDDAFKALLTDHEHRLPKPVAYYQRLAAMNDDGTLSDRDFYGELSVDFELSVEQLKQQFHDTHCRLEGTVQIIRELREHGYRIGLLSNVDRRLLEEFLDFKDTRQLFDETLASSEAGANKPDRKIFTVMAERLQTPFDEWFFVDDSRGNVEAAEGYGIASHAFTTPGKLRADLQARAIL